MPISRRNFLEILGAAGVTVSGDWFFSELESYARNRLAFQDVRGPGLTSFSRSVCRDCANHCSLALRKVDGLPVTLRGTPWHPVSLGGLCIAGQSQMQALFDRDRLRKPILRSDAGAAGTEGTWEEALGLLRGRLERCLNSGGEYRLAVIDGRTTSLGTRLLEAWTRSFPGATYIGLRPEPPLDRLIRPFLGGGRGGRLRFDLGRTGTLLLVGHELLEGDGSPVSQMRLHGDRRETPVRAHSPTLYLGPRRGATGIKSDYWLQCEPGQEREILLALAEALSRMHPDPTPTFAQYARWIPEARDPVDFARRFSLGKIAAQQGIKLKEMEIAVQALMRFPPSVVLPGPGVLQRAHGHADAEAALALNLWTGAFQEEGGLSWGEDPFSGIVAGMGLDPGEDPDPEGLSRILEPLLQIKRSPVDLLICVEANLVHELAGTDQIQRALSHVPFVASFSPTEDETSTVSHVTLPTLLDLESWDLPAPAWGFPETVFQVQRPAMKPVIEAPSVLDIVLDLASSGLAGPEFTSPTTDGAKGLVKTGVEALLASRRGRIIRSSGEASVSSMGSAAVRELMSGDAVWVDKSRPGPRARESTIERTPPPPPLDLAPNQFWLIAFDGPATHRGRLLNRPMMMELAGMAHGLAWESWVEIHPRLATRLHIAHGDRVRIRGTRGEITARAVVTRAIAPSVVAVPIGFGHESHGRVARGVGANPLTLPPAGLDPVTGLSAWGPMPVFIDKA